VFSDTPGILKPGYKLHESMMSFVKTALSDADILLFITDVYEDQPQDEKILHILKETETPVLTLINKMDQVDEEKVKNLVEKWKEILPNAEILPISALHNFNVDVVMNRIKELLPTSPAYYPKDSLTDKNERFFVTEIIREKILLNYKKEVPYSVEVLVESFKEAKDIIRISAIIIVSRDSQKGILIGHQGNRLKKVGTEARKDIEKFLHNKVFIELFVKVDKDWRDREDRLKQYGYLNS